MSLVLFYSFYKTTSALVMSVGNVNSCEFSLNPRLDSFGILRAAGNLLGHDFQCKTREGI